MRVWLHYFDNLEILLSSRSQMRVEIVVCKLINDKVSYKLLLLTHCK